MDNKAFIIIIGATALVLVGYLVFGFRVSAPPVATTQPGKTGVTSMPQEQVDYKAGFAIFTHDTFRVFTAPMYHNLSKDIYIAADNPNIIRVKKAGVTWDDFFKTLPLRLTKDCLTTGTKETFCTNGNGILRFYLNGKEDTNALDKQIVNGDSLLISFGTESDEQIQKQLQQIPRTN